MGKKVGIVGSGLIGKQWAMLFAGQGYDVVMYDVMSEQVTSALTYITDQLVQLEKEGFLRGNLSAVEQRKLIKGTDNLEECLKDAVHVQECVPDQIELKLEVFTKMDALAGDKTVLSSSSSIIPPSKFTENLKNRSNCLVSHPVNPPYHMPLVELVPAPWTDPEVVTRTKALMTEIGQSPVTLKKEVPGFIQPRVQYAAIQEALRLVQDDVMSAPDVDKILTYGMGYRYSFMGVLETAHLNAEGMESYRGRYGDMIYGIQCDSGPAVPMDPNSETMKKVYDQLCEVTPMEKLNERKAWRDDRIARLSKIKIDMDKADA